MIKRITSSKGIVTAVWVLGLVVIWEICAFIVGATQRTPVNVLPHLYQIIGSFFDTKSITGSGDTIATLVFSSAAETLSRALIGFIIGMVLGYVLALLMHMSNIVEKIAFPYLMIVALGGLVLGSILGYFIGVAGAVFKKWGMGGLTIVSAFNAIPLVALAPVINNWTRDLSNVVDIRSTVAKIITVTIFCTASMSVNAYRGLTEVKPFSEDLFASYGSSKLKMFFKLRLPNSLPYVFTALRVSVPSCIIGAVVSEYFAEQVIGVGRQIRENIVKGQFPTAWAYITIACVMGILMYIILLTVEAIVLKNRRAR